RSPILVQTIHDIEELGSIIHSLERCTQVLTPKTASDGLLSLINAIETADLRDSSSNTKKADLTQTNNFLAFQTLSAFIAHATSASVLRSMQYLTLIQGPLI